MQKKLTQKELKEKLDYNSETGEFIWKKQKTKQGKLFKLSGEKAGSLHSKGYIKINFKGKAFWAHRLAWLWVYGYLPENEITHINRINHDNRIENLKEITHVCNMQRHNMQIHKNNKSGIVGVSWDKLSKKWCVKIKHKILGHFPTMLEAAKVRYAAEKTYFNCFGESSAKKFIQSNT